MKKKRVAVLCHEELVPPDSIEGLSDEEISDYRTEFDVLSTLRDLGHEAEALGISDDVEVLRERLEEFRPHVCFNLMVEFHGVGHYDQHVVSYLELAKQRYTGCNPRGLTLARDKALSKKILAHDGIPVPRFALFPIGKKVKRPADLEFPLFVKSATEEASLGISKASIVKNDKQLAKRVAHIHAKTKTDAIAEQYIPGREFYVGVIGNERPRVLPVWELCIPGLAEGEPLIATRKVKWNIPYQKKMRIQNREAADLDEETLRRIRKIAKATYRSLELTGYARMDMRMTPEGELYVLEANPNPDLTYGEDFAEGAEAAGISYEELIEDIVRLGLGFKAGWESPA